jgi:hypothetical protein
MEASLMWSEDGGCDGERRRLELASTHPAPTLR